MSHFPKSELEVVALAEQMVAGFTAYATDFPSVTIADLSTALSTYKNSKQTQENAHGQAHIATVTKDDKLETLIELMKNDLKVSEVDTANDPEKLAEIGWGTKQPPQPLTIPGQPLDVHPIALGQGMIEFSWEKPATGSLVANYIIERRQQMASGEFGNWTIAGTSLNTNARLIEQPRSVQLEYHVKATNAAGASLPSNSIPVMLL